MKDEENITNFHLYSIAYLIIILPLKFNCEDR